jgi:L-lactate utilization protein LutC
MNQLDFLKRFKAPTTFTAPMFDKTELAAWENDLRAQLPAQYETLIKRFAESLVTAGGNFYRASDAEDAASLALKIAQERNVQSVVAWQHPIIETACAALQGAGMTIMTSIVNEHQTRETLRQASATAELGLTSCDYALAETGSLLLIGNAQQGRLTSLLPITHVAIITPTQLVPTLTDALKLLRHARLNGDGRLPSNVSLHTGPSKTADIEVVITKGVHGPKEVHVILVASR